MIGNQNERREEEPIDDAIPEPDSPSERGSREIMIALLKEEKAILDAVAAYPGYKDYVAQIAEDIRLINNPAFTQSVTITTQELYGLKGWHSPYMSSSGITITLERRLGLSDPFGFRGVGVNADTALTVGIYGDQETWESMKKYVANHPEFEHRLITGFAIDDEGNAARAFFVPVDFPIDVSTRRAIRVHADGKEKTVYDNIMPRDVEFMAFAIGSLRRKLPKK